MKTTCSRLHFGDIHIKHIVVISTSFPTNGTGSEAAGSFVADFCEQLSKTCKVTVFAPNTVANEIVHSDQFRIVFFKVPTLPLSNLKPTNPADLLAILKTLLSGRRIIRQFAEKEKIDHLFGLWVLPSGYWAKNIAGSLNISYSTWALGSDIWSLKNIPLVRQYLAHVLKKARVNFADGLQLLEDVKSLSGKDCRFLPSTRQLGEIPEKKMKKKGPYKLAYLGRWHQNKGVDILLEALRKLNSADWQLIDEIIVAGGGPLNDIVEENIAFLARDGRPVKRLGYLDKDAAKELLLWADFVFIPSRIESIPVIFSDAIKCQCGIISMPVGDIPEMFSMHEVGVLAENIDAISFADAIKKAIRSDCSEFGQAIDESRKIFELDHIVQSFLDQINTR